jgi:hypothetical protein
MSDLKDLTREIKKMLNRIKLEEKTSLFANPSIEEIKSGLEEIKIQMPKNHLLI